MTALEIRIIAYAVLALLVIGLSGYAGYRIASHHYEALMNREQIAQNTLVAQAQARVIETQQAQQAAAQAAEKQYADLTARNSTLSRSLSDSLHQYAALRTRLLSASVSTPSGVDATGASPGSDREVTDATAAAFTACLADSAQLTALQGWELK